MTNTKTKLINIKLFDGTLKGFLRIYCAEILTFIGCVFWLGAEMLKM